MLFRPSVIVLSNPYLFLLFFCQKFLKPAFHVLQPFVGALEMFELTLKFEHMQKSEHDDWPTTNDFSKPTRTSSNFTTSKRWSNMSPPKFTELNDLSCKDIGGKIIFATDDWFAGMYVTNRIQRSLLNLHVIWCHCHLGKPVRFERWVEN